MNGIIESLWARKSCRVFLEKVIEDTEKKLILDAAIQAPSAGNMALYAILDITDQALKDRLSITCDNQPFIAKAPLVLVFCADYQRWYDTFIAAGSEPRHPGEGDLMLAACDALIAAQNAVVAAEALGIGSCYIGDILERYEEHKELLNLPKYVLPVAMLVFGYPAPSQLARVKPKRLPANPLVHENGYQKKEATELLALQSSQNNRDGDELIRYLRAFCDRKYNSDFSLEMTRSVREMVNSWNS